MTFTRRNLQELWEWFESNPQQEQCLCHTTLCPACSFVSFVSFSDKDTIPTNQLLQHTHPGLKTPLHMVPLPSGVHA